MAEASGRPRDLDLVGFGSMVLDRMHRTHRILAANEKGLLEPMAGGALVEARIGGLMLNQLGWASLFGIRTGLFGRQAEDEPGRLLRAAMDRAGIEHHLDLSGSASSIAEIFIDREGERAIYMAAAATAETRPEHVSGDHSDFIARGRRLSTEISQLPLDTTLAALQIAHDHGLATALDLDILPRDAVPTLGDEATLEAVLRATDLLKPTALAARAFFPKETSLEAVARAMRQEFEIEVVVMTDGDNGAILASDTGEFRVEAFPVNFVNDSTGAGDAFFGGFLAGDALGCDLEAATRLGNACGAACVERLGAFPDDPAAAIARIESLLGEALPGRAPDRKES